MNISFPLVRSVVGSSLFALASGLAACGGDHPGGSVGDACSDIGTSDECAADEICDSVSGFGDGAYCLRSCEDQDECEAGENCNGISGSSGKACHPSDDADGETDEDPKK